MYDGDMTDPCLAGEAKLAQSVKTQSFDISTSYGDTWTSVSGSPLDLYVWGLLFIVCQHCQLFLHSVSNFVFFNIFLFITDTSLS